MPRLNRALEVLLASMAGRLDAGAADWAFASLSQNYGAIPPRPQVPPTSQRGFNLLLFGADGKPRHFARCRPAVSEPLLRETALLNRLASDGRVRAHIVPVVAESNDQMTAQLAPFIPGELLIHLACRMSAAQASAAVIEILEISAQLGEIAEGWNPTAPLDLLAAGSAPLDECVRAGLEPERAARLVAALEAAGTVRPVCQHGDLWVANVLRTRWGWVLIDFEHFGRYRVPLVDALQLVRSVAEHRWALEPRPWIGLLAEASERSAFCRGALGWAKRAAGLENRQALGAAAFALLEITARFFAAGRPEPAWRPSLDAAREFADLLDDEVTACHYLFGGQ